LWVLLLLSALAAAATYITRTNATLTHQNLVFAQAQAASDAAIVDTISRLSDEQVSRHPAFDIVQSWDFDGTPVAVTVSREDGRIDVNSAENELLSAFLQSQGISQDVSGKLLDELGGWKPLESLDELRRIPGWQEQPLDCWMESLTVYTQSPGISTSDAVPTALAALRWAQAHRLGNRNWIDSAAPLAAPNLNRSVIGEVLRIVVKATPGNGTAVTSEWVGRLTGDSHQPSLTMRWNHVAVVAPNCKDAVASSR
jgi:type II secretory pathway component PulK